ncbi:hypothetical protein CAG70_00640 [Photobacterium halotolerans]|uniref:hypothetical protein n=1 Tax=Photobacterium halotolerans TaxID=265726 RepID=UPI001372BDA6|nr:hypothetical protein [Photobacterium halotolerans]NAX45508.1 hypothetical protein [Photobacterium halotolerans]
MPEIFSSAKGIKAVHEASEILYLPATILALWSQISPWLVESYNVYVSLFIVCGIGLCSTLGLYQFLCWLSGYITRPPLFLIASTFFVGSGLIVIFQSKLPVDVNGITEFTGFALVAWGFMLETVQSRVNEKEREILDF